VSLIDKLNFGQDSAESEIETLHKVFLSTPFYNNLKSQKLKKWLVIGRKGSGKTAACLMLFRQLRNEHQVSLIAPESLAKW
jgi:Cdc6-like AAA superfamily ATPase